MATHKNLVGRKLAVQGALVASALAFFAASACSSDESPADSGKGATGASAGAGGKGSGGVSGSGGAPPVQCGSATCDPVPSELGNLGVTACCTSADACGLKTPLAADCLEPDQPGGIDPSCPEFTIPAVSATLPGCCRPEGTCGQLDTAMGLGCISREQLGETPVDCVYDPTNDCTQIMPLVCDGPEDCPAPQVCCAEYGGSTYTSAGCYDNCETIDSGAVIWLELCHPGQTCQGSGYECLTSEFLPAGLYRCYNTGNPPGAPGSTAAGEVNCGTTVCSSSETCCLPAPHEPYCGPAGVDCRCTPGSGDAGSDAGADASDDAQSDSSTDAPASG